MTFKCRIGWEHHDVTVQVNTLPRIGEMVRVTRPNNYKCVLLVVVEILHALDQKDTQILVRCRMHKGAGTTEGG